MGEIGTDIRGKPGGMFIVREQEFKSAPVIAVTFP
jgi:hypothetical protein